VKVCASIGGVRTEERRSSGLPSCKEEQSGGGDGVFLMVEAKVKVDETLAKAVRAQAVL
jgi:hypothetical protein